MPYSAFDELNQNIIILIWSILGLAGNINKYQKTIVFSMAKVDKKKLEELKSDQETLKKELAELETYLQRKGIKHERVEAGREVTPRGRVRPRPYRPSVAETRTLSEISEETNELLRVNLDESKKLMEKFDYLLDTLITSTEEAEAENVEEIVEGR